MEQDVDTKHTFNLSERALKRKSTWNSREEAEEYLKAKPMFSSIMVLFMILSLFLMF